MDCTVHGVAKSQTRLSDFYFTPLPVPGTLQRSLSVGSPPSSPLLISCPIPAFPGHCGELGSFSAVTGPETRRGGARERQGAVRSLVRVLAQESDRTQLSPGSSTDQLCGLFQVTKLSEPRLPYLSNGNKP